MMIKECMKMKTTVGVKMWLTVMGIFLGVLGMLQGGIPSVLAAQNTGIEQGKLMTAVRRVEVRETPDDGAAVIMTYEEGSAVFAIGESVDGWYRVIYQGQEGYVPENALHAQEIDVEGLDAEMAQEAEEARFMIETIERYQSEARRSKIWGGVIVALIVGVFAMGIISEIRGKKEDGHRNDDGV